MCLSRELFIRVITYVLTVCSSVADPCGMNSPAVRALVSLRLATCVRDRGEKDAHYVLHAARMQVRLLTVGFSYSLVSCSVCEASARRPANSLSATWGKYLAMNESPLKKYEATIRAGDEFLSNTGRVFVQGGVHPQKHRQVLVHGPLENMRIASQKYGGKQSSVDE